MIQATIRLVAPKEKRQKVLDVLLCLKSPIDALAECRGCWICQDIADDHALTYLSQWDTQDDLESHLRSVRFRRLLPYIEMSADLPAVSFGSIEHIRGIEFLVQALSSEQS